MTPSTNTTAIMAGAAAGLLTFVLGAPLWAGILVASGGALVVKQVIE